MGRWSCDSHVIGQATAGGWSCDRLGYCRWVVGGRKAFVSHCVN